MGKRGIFFWIALLILGLGACSNEATRPEVLDNQPVDDVEMQALNEEMELTVEDEMVEITGEGVYTLGWRQVYRPRMQRPVIEGYARAIGFESPRSLNPPFRGEGVDMGEVSISLNDYSRDLIRMEPKRRDGTFYVLNDRILRRTDDRGSIRFVSGAEYTFDASGSDVFEKVSLTAAAPQALLRFTSHRMGTVVDPSDDLTVQWRGNDGQKRTVLRISVLHRNVNEAGEQVHGGPKRIFREMKFIPLKPGVNQITIPSERIQKALGDSDMGMITLQVAQFDIQHQQVDDRNFAVVIRNGDRLLLRARAIQEE